MNEKISFFDGCIEDDIFAPLRRKEVEKNEEDKEDDLTEVPDDEDLVTVDWI